MNPKPLPAADAVPPGADTERHRLIRARVDADTATRYERRWLTDQYTFHGKRAAGHHDPAGRARRTLDVNDEVLDAEADERRYAAAPRPQASAGGAWWPHPDYQPDQLADQ